MLTIVYVFLWISGGMAVLSGLLLLFGGSETADRAVVVGSVSIGVFFVLLLAVLVLRWAGMV